MARQDTQACAAIIVWYADSNCNAVADGPTNFYCVPGLGNEGTFDPDQCDPGGSSDLPWSNDDGTLNTGPLPITVASFQVTDTTDTCTSTTGNSQLGAVTLYPNCQRAYDTADYNYYCPDSCATEGWSLNSGYDGCNQVPDYASTTGTPAFAIAQHLTFCT